MVRAFIGDNYLKVFGKLRGSRSQITVQQSQGGMSKSRKGSISAHTGRGEMTPTPNNNNVRFSCEELGDVNLSLANKSSSTTNNNQQQHQLNQRGGAIGMGKSISGFTTDSYTSKVQRIQSAKTRKTQAALYAAANHEL